MPNTTFVQNLTNISESIRRKAPIVIIVFVIFYLIFSTLIIPNISAFSNIHLLSTIRSNERDIQISSQDSLNVIFLVISADEIKETYLINSQSATTIIKLPQILTYSDYDSILASRSFTVMKDKVDDHIAIFTDRIIVFQEDDLKEMYQITNTDNLYHLLNSLNNNTLFFRYSHLANQLGKKMISNFSDYEFQDMINRLKSSIRMGYVDLSAFDNTTLVTEISRSIESEQIVREQARIEISNASQIVGEAGNAAVKLKNMGYFISKVGNFDIVTDKDMILVKNADKYKYTLDSLKRIYPDGEIKYQGINELSIADILVILGKK